LNEENDLNGLRTDINDDLGYDIEKSFEDDKEDNTQLGASEVFKVWHIFTC
jgi:hypothetical protein